MLLNLLRLFTLAVAGQAVTVQDCGAAAAAPAAPLLGLRFNSSVPAPSAAEVSLFRVNSVTISPSNPVPGQAIDLHLDYTVPDGIIIKDGTTTYDFTLNFVPLSPSSNPLCQDIPCPLGPGTYSNVSSSTWPSGVTGSFTSTMRWRKAVDNTLLLCIKIAGRLGNLRKSPEHF